MSLYIGNDVHGSQFLARELGGELNLWTHGYMLKPMPLVIKKTVQVRQAYGIRGGKFFIGYGSRSSCRLESI